MEIRKVQSTKGADRFIFRRKAQTELDACRRKRQYSKSEIYRDNYYGCGTRVMNITLNLLIIE